MSCVVIMLLREIVGVDIRLAAPFDIAQSAQGVIIWWRQLDVCRSN